MAPEQITPEQIAPEQIADVRRTFSAVVPHADAVAASFYAHLFAREPGLRALFAADLAEQREKLMLTLTLVVGELDRLEAILPQVRGLAVRHLRYGTEDRHYPLVGAALIAALADHLPHFSPAEQAAWGAAYAVLSAAMIAAAREARARAA